MISRFLDYNVHIPPLCPYRESRRKHVYHQTKACLKDDCEAVDVDGMDTGKSSLPRYGKSLKVIK